MACLELQVSIYPTLLQHGKLIRAGLSCLVHQAIFTSLSPQVRSDRVHGQVGPACRGRLRPWSVGTRGYPCLTSSRSTCRRSGGDEVTLMRSEDVASMKSHRVHGDKKILLSAYEGEHHVSGDQVQGLEVKTRRCRCLKNRRPNRNQVNATHLQGRR
jgi:hypothetical protein